MPSTTCIFGPIMSGLSLKMLPKIVIKSARNSSTLNYPTGPTQTKFCFMKRTHCTAEIYYKDFVIRPINMGRENSKYDNDFYRS